MPATGLSRAGFSLRRTLVRPSDAKRARLLALFVCLSPSFAADPAAEVWDLLTQVASALGERNPDSVVAAFDPTMPGYQKLRTSVTTLLRNAEVQSSIELAADEGDAVDRTVELDWLLKIRPDGDATTSTRREQRVKCRLRKTGKKWRIVSFEPLEFFEPPEK